MIPLPIPPGFTDVETHRVVGARPGPPLRLTVAAIREGQLVYASVEVRNVSDEDRFCPMPGPNEITFEVETLRKGRWAAAETAVNPALPFLRSYVVEDTFWLPAGARLTNDFRLRLIAPLPSGPLRIRAHLCYPSLVTGEEKKPVEWELFSFWHSVVVRKSASITARKGKR